MNRLVAWGLAILVSPLLCLVALAILVSDGLPLLYIQSRLGQNRRPFRIYKFRTMRDGKVSCIGRLLRRSGLDELPQLYNIIKADVNIIGPRPLTMADITRLGWQVADCDWRWSVKPGISGLAQLTRVCSARLSLRLDGHYVSHKSWRYDLRILLGSLSIPCKGRKKAAKTASALKKRL